MDKPNEQWTAEKRANEIKEFPLSPPSQSPAPLSDVAWLFPKSILMNINIGVQNPSIIKVHDIKRLFNLYKFGFEGNTKFVPRDGIEKIIWMKDIITHFKEKFLLFHTPWYASKGVLDDYTVSTLNADEVDEVAYKTWKFLSTTPIHGRCKKLKVYGPIGILFDIDNIEKFYGMSSMDMARPMSKAVDKTMIENWFKDLSQLQKVQKSKIMVNRYYSSELDKFESPLDGLKQTATNCSGECVVDADIKKAIGVLVVFPSKDDDFLFDDNNRMLEYRRKLINLAAQLASRLSLPLLQLENNDPLTIKEM